MLKVERCMQFRLMLSLIIREHPTSIIKDRTPFGSPPDATISARHRQLNDLRQVHPFRSIGSGTRGACHLAPDSEGLSSGRTMISCIGVGRTAEEVRDLIMNREKSLRLPG